MQNARRTGRRGVVAAVVATTLGMLIGGAAEADRGASTDPTPGAAQLELSGDRIGVVTEDGRALVKQGAPDAPWVTELRGVGSIALSGDRIGVLTTDGRALVKEGSLHGSWVTVHSGVEQLVLSGDRIGVLTTDHRALVKQGSTHAGWTTVRTGTRQLALAGNRIAVVDDSRLADVKEGTLSAAWVRVRTRVDGISLAGRRIGVVVDDHTYVKEGGLHTAWTEVSDWDRGSLYRIVVSPGRIAVVTSRGWVNVNEGSVRAPFVGLDIDNVSRDVALTDARVGLIISGSTLRPDFVLVKEGPLSGPWVQLALPAA